MLHFVKKIVVSKDMPTAKNIAWYNPVADTLNFYNNGKWEPVGGTSGHIVVTTDSLTYGDNTVVKVDEYGTHIYNSYGQEFGTFTDDGITLGYSDGLHVDVANQGATCISDGEGNHIIEVDGTNVYFNDPEGNNHFKFNSATGLVQIMSPDGTKTIDFTNSVIDAINALV